MKPNKLRDAEYKQANYWHRQEQENEGKFFITDLDYDSFCIGWDLAKATYTKEKKR